VGYGIPRLFFVVEGPQRRGRVTEPDTIVYVVEDDAAMRAAIDSLLRAEGFSVRSFSSAAEFHRRPATDALTCLVLDVDLPGQNGLELQRALASREPALPVVFITGHGDIRMSVRAIKAGAVEFLPKPFLDNDLLGAIEQALKEAGAARVASAEVSQLRARFDSLTPRERQVLTGVVAGMLNKQIAYELGISEVTVKIHRGQVMQKTQASSVPELVRMTERVGIRPDQP
jgi:FixJ family two-component response regulator